MPNKLTDSIHIKTAQQKQKTNKQQRESNGEKTSNKTNYRKTIEINAFFYCIQQQQQNL